MTEIYLEISKLSDKFRTMCYGITKNKEDIDDAVQELMMYFMQMNPETLKSIWEKDGEDGIIRYGAVVLKRALTSPRSPFYYKYKRYNELMNNMEGYYIYNKDPLTKEKLKEFEIKEEKLKWIEKKLEGLHWFDVSVFKIYFKEGFSLNSMSRATKINRSTLGKSIRFVKNYLKNEQEK